MNNVFYIDNLGAQNRSPNYNSFLTKDILGDICKRITGSGEFEVRLDNQKRNKGRLIKLEQRNEKKLHYINLSQYGVIQGRNYFFQSISTALSQFYDEINKDGYDRQFYFYFLPFDGNITTDYYLFLYRILSTIGITFLNAEEAISNVNIIQFASIRDMINERQRLQGRNSGNNSTYMSDDSDCYSVYGKTFGANEKETILFCLAMIAMSNKKIKLFQILDNDNEKIGEADKNLLNNYSSFGKYSAIEIIEDSFSFEEICREENLRSPRFIYNLLKKTNGEKKCALCDCHIDRIIQGAHIYSISDIRKASGLTNEKRLELATNENNGLWLCENHHKLFDSNVIKFNKGTVEFCNISMKRDFDFLNKITTYKKLDSNIYNDEMENYFNLRYSKEYT